jgi:hypothetical protein
MVLSRMVLSRMVLSFMVVPPSTMGEASVLNLHDWDRDQKSFTSQTLNAGQMNLA